MTNHTLFDLQEVIGKLWSEDQSPEQARILGLARDALLFVSATGQQYHFEDFRKGLGAGARPSIGTAPTPRFEELQERLRQTEGFFTKLRDEAGSSRRKELLQVILDTLLFIASTGQHGAFGEYLEHVEAGAPPYVIASFETKEEAEAWLRNHPSPPDSANVLIANQYHHVIYERDINIRRLLRGRDLEYYLAEFREKEPPVAAASFASLEEAEAWWRAQPTPARWAWVSIAGEFYVAADYPNIGHRALYPLSLAKGYSV
jgi:hypothetical protein